MTKKSRRHRKMENKIEIIAIDHGWSNIKTVNTVFTTAVNRIANDRESLTMFFNMKEIIIR